jgi:hypothetical protein
MHARSINGILEGRKTQTRRIMKAKHVTAAGIRGILHGTGPAFDLNECPFGQPSDRLWVREAWRTRAIFDDLKPSEVVKRVGKDLLYLADGQFLNISGVHDVFVPGRYRHGRFMPRWACRLVLEITDIRVERVQDISEEDAYAEGIPRPSMGFDQLFARLWDDTNGSGAWSRNDWVWCVSFRKVDG